MKDILFAWVVGIILAMMVFLMIQALLVSCIAMVTNDNTFNQDYALFTVKAWLPAGNQVGPRAFNFVRDSVPYTKEHFDEYQRDHDEYTIKHNKQFTYRKYFRVK